MSRTRQPNRIRWGTCRSRYSGDLRRTGFMHPRASDAKLRPTPRLIRVHDVQTTRWDTAHGAGCAFVICAGVCRCDATNSSRRQRGTYRVPLRIHRRLRPRAPRFPAGAVTLMPAKAAALQETQAAIGAAQKKAPAYGLALQRLDGAITAQLGKPLGRWW